jgi:hypothetical protein
MSAFHSPAEYNTLMGIIQVNAWKCDECGYVWLKVAGRVPRQCPSKKCRSRKWNDKAIWERSENGMRIGIGTLPAGMAPVSGGKPISSHHPSCKCAMCGK